MFSHRSAKAVAAGAAIVAVAIGGFAIGNSSSGNSTSNTANAAQFRGPHQTPQSGQLPKGWHPGSGTIITGAAAEKATAAARVKYPAGTVNRVLKLSDGSYAVHIIGTSGPHHVFVSKDFKITGTG